MNASSFTGFKALIACLYAFQFSYLVALFLRNASTFKNKGISQIITSGLCTNSFTQSWVNKVYQCSSLVGDMDYSMDYHNVSFFENASSDNVVLIKTTKVNKDSEVTDMSHLAQATHTLLSICQMLEKKGAINIKVKNQESFGMLIDVCPIIQQHIKVTTGSTLSSMETNDTWDLVRILLNNPVSIKGGSILSLVSQVLDTINVNGRAPVDEIKSILRSFIDYTCEMQMPIKHAKAIMTEEIMRQQHPLKFVAEHALSRDANVRMGGEADNIVRIFTTFPEAAATLLYATQNKIAMYPSIAGRNVEERLRNLALFIANLQVMTSTTLSGLMRFAQIASANDLDATANVPLGHFWQAFVTDRRSKIYLMNALERASNVHIREGLHETMEDNIILAARVTTYIANDEGTFDMSMHGRRRLINSTVSNMVQMCKFMMVDVDKSGYLTLQEFVASLLQNEEEEDRFNKHLAKSLEGTNGLFMYYDFDFLNGQAMILKRKMRKELEAINPVYNEILDNFMIVDTDGSGEISLEEYLDSYSLTRKYDAIDATE